MPPPAPLDMPLFFRFFIFLPPLSSVKTSSADGFVIQSQLPHVHVLGMAQYDGEKKPGGFTEITYIAKQFMHEN